MTHRATTNAAASAAAPGAARRPALLAALWLALLTLVTYLPAANLGFIWDDDYYVLNNPTLRSGQGLVDIWLRPSALPQYYPLVHSSFWVEYQIFGRDSRIFHLDNVLLQAAAAIALWLVLAKLRIPGAFLAAALFAIHPVQVESVAWITERKNVLSGLLYFLAALALVPVFRLEEPTALPADADHTPQRLWPRYLLGLALFAGALMSKSVTCSLPAALLLVVYWKQGRIRLRQALLTAPLFALGLAAGLTTAYLERLHVGASGPDWAFTFAQRLLIAGRAVWFYAGKIFWPAELSFIYPRWEIDAGAWWQWLFPAAAVALLALLVAMRRRLGRGPLAAVLFFGGTLLPALGFFNIYPMLFSFVADHFQYLACTGLIVLAAAALATVLDRWEDAAPRWGRLARWAVPAIVVTVLALISRAQLPAYQNVQTLWGDTLEHNPRAWMAHANLGNVLLLQDQQELAQEHLYTALLLRLDNDAALHNLGNLRRKQGRLDEATRLYQRALRVEPKQRFARLALAEILEEQGQYAQARINYAHIVQDMPHFDEALMDLAMLLASCPQEDLRNLELAGQLTAQAAQVIDSQNASSVARLAQLCAALKQWDKAVILAERAAQLAKDGGMTKMADDFAVQGQRYQHQRGPGAPEPPASQPRDQED